MSNESSFTYTFRPSSSSYWIASDAWSTENCVSRRSLSAFLRPVMSSFTARKCVISPFAFVMGVIEADSQKLSPFFFLLQNSPDQTFPCLTVDHKSRYRFGEVCPALRMLGV